MMEMQENSFAFTIFYGTSAVSLFTIPQGIEMLSLLFLWGPVGVYMQVGEIKGEGKGLLKLMDSDKFMVDPNIL